MFARSAIRVAFGVGLSIGIAGCGEHGPTYEWVLEIDPDWESTLDRGAVLGDAVEVLRHRLESLNKMAREFDWGVRGRRVERVGDDRIRLEISGPEAATFDIENVLRGAQLELSIVSDGSRFRSALAMLDSVLSAASGVARGSLSALLSDSTNDGEFRLDAPDAARVMAYLAIPRVAGAVPNDIRLAWSGADQPIGKGSSQSLYILEADPLITNEHFADAVATFGDYGAWLVSFTLTPSGGDLFAEATARHIGDRLAILLDGQVQGSPPVIRARIGKRGQIELRKETSGAYAAGLAATLRSGSLPAPLIVVDQRLVAPQS